MEQSQRKQVKPQEAQNKRECNYPEQHQQERREEAFKTGQQKKVILFLTVPSYHAFSQVAGKFTKQTTKIKQITNNVISPKSHQPKKKKNIFF